MRLVTSLLLSCALIALAGCGSPRSTTNDDGPGKARPGASAASADPNDGAYYQESRHDSRIYVFSNASTYESWKTTRHMPYTRTKVGAGPRGETLVFEIDKKNESWTDWLEEMYAWTHQDDPTPYYAEEVHDGRVYVLGSEKTHAAFRKTHHLPYTRTLVAAGPGGRTLVFEVDKKDEGLAPWLEREFEMRNPGGIRR